MKPAKPFAFTTIALVSRRSAGEWIHGPLTHKRHEAGSQGVVV